ncbi:uncharacterized protein SPAPADRAFT_136216 [Spathaspora passalidarum NRRL Y-27907]|uniref:Zn(2)-C6 fungal-type domain-containing protein n=1 Tax=Spathaspora passalidarum (strain NRRL Y-27907 / 11-Y1) TaxID=619300 RepID=G3ALL3_SPAPN|nr:uncharacterized protein SPAPADRAFT_136216 [Spathaspora passalidarum NRRL Y-27907]EGW33256.1 hypothetical protein SPAPADRAFT_136216 [Spathaspora passalidarum NRRL Y-27907]
MKQDDEQTEIKQPSSVSSPSNGDSAKTNGGGSNSGNGEAKPKAFTIRYKRPRGSRACTVCRSRKVRCDAEIHIPCTNCITFGCDCILPEAKKRGNAAGATTTKSVKNKKKKDDNVKTQQNKKKKQKHSEDEDDSENQEGDDDHDYDEEHKAKKIKHDSHTSINHSANSSGTNGVTSSTNQAILNISQISVPPSLHSDYKNRPSIHKKEILSNKHPQKPALTFLGSSSNVVVPHAIGENHVRLTEDIFEVNENSLDSVELEILKLRGAFLLPPRELALDLIEAYFEHVHPLMPVINRTMFMKKFNDPNDSPSLMLLHAVLLCGCRVSKNPLLLDSSGSNSLAALTFFRRAKALYETNYESDPVSIIQTIILIGSYWDGPEDVTKNSFYWTRVAVGLAQGFGFQRDVSNSRNLTCSEKKLWRRIWWCLFEKDRNVAIAFGRPIVIDLNDCDVPMLTLDDFNEDDPELGIVSPYPVNETQALYFIHLVKLAEITGIIIKHQYSVKSESMKLKNVFSIIEHCDMLMGIWFTNLPPQLVFSLTDNATQNFYSCLLNAQYYNRLYLIHRSNLIRMAKSSSTNPNNYKYPSWGISFQSARMISIISKILLDRDQIKYVPSMYVYITFSALVMLIYHVDSANTVIASTASDSLYVSRSVLKELSKYWPIAGVLMKLFDKYANDKWKRAKVIEHRSQHAEYTENKKGGYMGLYSQVPVQPSQQQVQQQAQELSPHNDGSSIYSGASGISPGGNVYDYPAFSSQAQLNNQSNSVRQVATPTVTTPQQQQQQQQQQQSNDIQTQAAAPNIEDLIQQYKIPMKRAAESEQSTSTSDTSPTSSTKSFPEINLVTDSQIATQQNFFENFEPTQLFPNFSQPPTRSQSPHPDHQVGSNVYQSLEHLSGIEERRDSEDRENEPKQQSQPQSQVVQPSPHVAMIPDENYTPGFNPNTPGFQTNFVDSSYINMNLQSGVEMQDDFTGLFNFVK